MTEDEMKREADRIHAENQEAGLCAHQRFLSEGMLHLIAQMIDPKALYSLILISPETKQVMMFGTLTRKQVGELSDIIRNSEN